MTDEEPYPEDMPGIRKVEGQDIVIGEVESKGNGMWFLAVMLAVPLWFIYKEVADVAEVLVEYLTAKMPTPK